MQYSVSEGVEVFDTEANTLECFSLIVSALGNAV